MTKKSALGIRLAALAICIALMPVMYLLQAAENQSSTQPATQPTTKPAPKHAAVTPAPRTDDFWMQRNQLLNHQIAQGGFDLLFIGDSITQGWEGEGKEVWAERYGDRHAANLGIGGDRTQHVLWRLQNGNLKGMESNPPKLAVLMIGTNNSNGDDNTAQEIADGVVEIVTTLRRALPRTKILLLAIFPRGERPDAQRAKNATASELASKVADGEFVHFMDIGASFLEPDGRLDKMIMPDFLHLSAEGYRRWADAIEPKVKELMGE